MEQQEEETEKPNTKTEAGLKVNTHYPKTNLKRWSTPRLQPVDLNTPSTYDIRLAKLMAKRQSSLEQAWSSSLDEAS